MIVLYQIVSEQRRIIMSSILKPKQKPKDERVERKIFNLIRIQPFLLCEKEM